MTHVCVPITNYLAPREVSVFNDRLRLEPVRTDDLPAYDSGQAIETVYTSTRLDTDLLDQFSRTLGESVEVEFFMSHLCDLLSFASRRGVSYRPLAEGIKPVVRGGVSNRGPVESIDEISNLLERGLSITFNPTYESDYRRVSALRYFLGWLETPGVDLRLIRLWIVLEMLALYDHKQNRTMYSASVGDIYKFDRVKEFLYNREIPDTDTIPLREFYLARNSLVHGNIDNAERRASGWFGTHVKDRVEGLERSRKQWDGERLHNLPKPDHFGSCLMIANDIVSRLLEKVFLNLFACTDAWFYLNAKYNSSLAP